MSNALLRRLLVCWCCIGICISPCLAAGIDIKSASAASDTYVDSGLGWYVRGNNLVFEPSTLCTFKTNYNRNYNKIGSGAGLFFFVPAPDNSYIMVLFASTVKSSDNIGVRAVPTGSGTTISYLNNSYTLNYNGKTIYYYANAFGGASGFVPGVVDLMPSSLFTGSTGSSDYEATLINCLDYVGFTTSEPEPPAPSTLFVAGTYNNRPVQVQYGPLITESVFTQSETLGASYNLYDAAYTPILSSSDFVPISGNYKYQVNPVGYNAEYVCFETISYSASDYSSIDVSGEFTFYIQSDYYPLVGGQDHRYIFPDSAYLYVNGERVYSQVQSLGNGQFRFSGTLNLSELGNIVSIGVWANFTDTIVQIGATSFDVGFFGDNNLVLTPTAATTVTPDPDATIGDLQVDTQKIEDGINMEIQKQITIIQQLMSLPQTIGDAISNAFIPDAQLMDDYRDLYGNLFEDRLGFVWQAGTVVLDFVGDLQELLSGIDEDYDLIFPGVNFTIQGQTYQLVPLYQVDLENDLMDVLRPTLGTIVGFVCTIAFINTCRDMVISLSSGASYMEYIHRREGDNQ